MPVLKFCRGCGKKTQHNRNGLKWECTRCAPADVGEQGASQR